MRDSNARLQEDARQLGRWLLETAVFLPDLGEALRQLCERIVAVGVPLARATTAVQLLHASNQGVGREWRIGEPMIERVYPYGPQSESSYERSPFRIAHQTGQWLVLKPQQMADDAFGVMPDLKSSGYTHYICIPLTFSSGRNRNGLTLATRDRRGFSKAHLAFFREIVPTIRAVMEIRAGERILDEVLETYVGRDPHARILAGDVHRGKVTRIRSAILFCDLRGYTQLTMTLTEEDIAELLNRYFDCIVPEVETRRGEILKFIGDGVLAMFQDTTGDGIRACRDALAAARASLRRLAVINSHGSLPAAIDAGIALHYGEASYGNVGSGTRLDFTVIGRDINVANRITRLNGPLGRPILMSEAFASRAGGGCVDAGLHELKGIDEPHRLFTPATATKEAS